MMQRCCFVLAAAAVLAFSSSSLHAQDIPQASSGGFLQVGAAYSNASTDEFPKRISGASVYATYDLRPSFGLEADVHFLNFGTPNDFAEDTYLVGPRYVLHFGRYQPYAKVLAGIGRTLNQESYQHAPGTPGSYFAVSFGAGLDIAFSHHINVRAIDFERQDWPGFPPNGLTPTMISVGVAYRLR